MRALDYAAIVGAVLLLLAWTRAEAATCGNGQCEVKPDGTGERASNCPQDCHCGDGVCYPRDGETSANCAADCACGDGCCDRDEFTAGSCNADCHGTLPAGPCGNGCLNAGEACDFAGYWTSAQFCITPAAGSWMCTLQPPQCGNGVVELGEQCDDGDENSDLAPDACRTDCRAANCGDHVVDSGERCDDGNSTNGDGCDSNCTPSGCGNGIVTAPEICDDHNLVDGDGCDSNCKPTGCGNGIVTGTEICDDGNTSNEDGCLNTCVPNVCGDGVVNRSVVNGQQVEVCDDGNTVDGDGCSYDCSKDLTRCGNQTREQGEVCDFGVLNTNSPDAVCRLDCEVPRCGDGVVDPQRGETCDRSAGCGALCAAVP